MKKNSSFKIWRKEERGTKGAAAFFCAWLSFLLYKGKSFHLSTVGVFLCALVAGAVFLYGFSMYRGKKAVLICDVSYIGISVLFFCFGGVSGALLSFFSRIADYLSEYGMTGDIFHRITSGVSESIRADSVEVVPFVAGAFSLSLIFLILFVKIWEKCPALMTGVVVMGMIFPCIFRGIYPEPASVCCFLVFCFLALAPFVWSGVYAALIVCLIFGISVLMDGPENVKNATVKTKWEQMRYGMEEGGLPEGNLTHAGEKKRENTPALRVSVSKKDSYYFRGFVGSVYEDNAWKGGVEEPDLFGTGSNMFETLEQEAYHKLIWLHKKNFYGTNLMYTLMKTNVKAAGEKIPSLYKVSVENVGANRKYLYLPYECATSAGFYEEEKTASVNRLEGLRAGGFRGVEEYSFLTMQNMAGQLKAEKSLNQNDGKASVKKMLKTYESYVDATCLYLSKETKTQLAGAVGEPLKGDELSTRYIIEKVKKWMRESVKYKENPGVIPEGEDFVSWFFENKEGFDVQYAAAAVLLFRYYGLPARYAEGYILTPKTLENSGNSGEVDITNRYAHAWPEVYFEGAGWIPVEVVPEYDQVMGAPYYATKEEAIVSNAQVSEEPLEKEEKEAEKKIGKTEQETGENAQKEEKKSRSRQKETEKNDAGNKRKVLGILLLLCLLLSIILFLFREKIKEEILEIKGKKFMQNAQYDRAVELYMDVLWKTLGENGRNPVDNRVRTLEKCLREGDKTLDTKAFRHCMALRQKAVYSPGGITEEEALRVIDFLKKEKEKMKKNK
ncbi:MAG: transglutaminase-like domain-containing protein [Anaerobutyricum sp.]|nr:transglutaminase-like domain-containing protein [Anaerobutyricum sp.]